jgi:hypothetical protein
MCLYDAYWQNWRVAASRKEDVRRLMAHCSLMGTNASYFTKTNSESATNASYERFETRNLSPSFDDV